MIWDEAKYKTKLKYPEKNDFRTYYMYQKGNCIVSGDIKDIAEHIGWCSTDAAHYSNNIVADAKNKGYTVEIFVDEDAYNHYRLEYNTDESKLHGKYLDDLYEREYSLEFDRETFNVCYSYAYDRGHSAGYGEVENCLNDVAEFAERIIMSIKK